MFCFKSSNSLARFQCICPWIKGNTPLCNVDASRLSTKIRTIEAFRFLTQEKTGKCSKTKLSVVCIQRYFLLRIPQYPLKFKSWIFPKSVASSLNVQIPLKNITIINLEGYCKILVLIPVFQLYWIRCFNTKSKAPEAVNEGPRTSQSSIAL